MVNLSYMDFEASRSVPVWIERDAKTFHIDLHPLLSSDLDCE